MAKEESKRAESDGYDDGRPKVDRSYMNTWGSTVSNKANFAAEAESEREEKGADDDRPVTGVNPVVAPNADPVEKSDEKK